MLILYSNERVIKHGNEYYARIINFTDFLVLLSEQSGDYRLALSSDTENVEGIDPARLTPLGLTSGSILELPFLRNRYQSLIYSLRLALRIRRFIRRQVPPVDQLGVVSPGLNSITFVLSFLLPRQTRWYLFMRGDTRKTVDEVYHDSPLRRLMTSVIDLFQWRVHALLRQGRATSFVFGQALRDKFYRDFKQRTHVISPLLSRDWIDTPSARDRLAPLSERNPRILFVGRLSAEKNIVQLIEACAMAAPSRHRFDLTVVGDGPLDEVLRDSVNKLGIEAAVKFTGRVANGASLIDLYDCHDLFCLPSKTEGTPRAVAESVARGLPIVASDVGSIAYMFSPGTVQLLGGTNARDILASLADAIDHLDECSERAHQRRGEAEQHTLDYNASLVHEIIQQDLGESSCV